MSVFVHLHRVFTVTTSPSRENLEKHIEAVLDELLDLEETGCGLSDSTIGADFGTGSVEVEVLATGVDYDAAVALGESCIRAAIHAAGGNTPDWVSNSSHYDLVDA